MRRRGLELLRGGFGCKRLWLGGGAELEESHLDLAGRCGRWKKLERC